MALLPILTAPDPRLKKKALPVEAVTDEIRHLMLNMLETMYENEGYGLAATQVGIAKRILVMDLTPPEDVDPGEEDLSGAEILERRQAKSTKLYQMANPEILWTSLDTSVVDEACLSVPYQHAKVERPAHVRLRYTDENNVNHEIEADDLLATCVQHEIDHLDGILYIDHLSKLKRELIMRKLLKIKKLEAQ